MTWQNVVYPLCVMVGFCFIFGVLTWQITRNGWDIIQLPFLRLFSVILAGVGLAKATIWLHNQQGLSFPMNEPDYKKVVGLIGCVCYLLTIYFIRWWTVRKLMRTNR